MSLLRQSHSLHTSARASPTSRQAKETAGALAGLILPRPQASARPASAKVPGRSSKARATAPRESNNTRRIVEAVRTAIAERRLLPGTKLAEQQVADIFEVSRSIVRQALHQLEQVRLVSLEPARGAFVRQPDAAEGAELFDVRATLEGTLVGRLAARLSVAQLSILRRHLADEAAAITRGDAESPTRPLADFHRLLAAMSGNQVLAEVLGDLICRSALIPLSGQTPDAEHTHDDHVQIANALADRNATLASRLMAEHLAKLGTALRGFSVPRDLASETHLRRDALAP